MDTSNSSKYYYSAIAAAADICFKPRKHSVIDRGSSLNFQNINESIELIMSIESRNVDGDRTPYFDLELEIYRSGNELNLTIFWTNQEILPILWQGKHSVWMDPVSGKKTIAPSDSYQLESLARRLRAMFENI